MDKQRQRIRITLLVCTIVWISVLCVSGCTQIPAPIRQHAPEPPNVASKATSPARRLALERYAFVKRLAPKFGELPLDIASGDTSREIVPMFPVGRSDRVYIFFWNDPEQGNTEHDQIFCYQHKDGQDELVYQLNLDVTNRPATKARPVRKMKQITSLLDYVHSRGILNTDNGVGNSPSYAFVGQPSDLALKDLAAKRDYVEYRYYGMGDMLEFYCLSELTNSEFADQFDEQYLLDQDLVTKKTSTPEEFFRKYGLPVAKGELIGK